MHSYRIILLVISYSILISAQKNELNATEIAELKTLVENSAQATQTIKSDFVQFRHLSFLDNDIETSGKLTFKAPGMVKWEYTSPFQYVVVFKGDKLLINDGGTKSDIDIGSNKLFKKLNNLIVNSIKGDLFEDEDFTISYFDATNAYKAIFIPKDKKIVQYIGSFELLFDKKDGSVNEVKMIEPSNDFTQIVFSNRVLNSPVDDAVFTN